MSAGRVIKIILIIFVGGLVVAGVAGAELYRKAFSPNVSVKEGNEAYFYVTGKMNYDDVFRQLENEGRLKNLKTFDWTAQRKNYQNNIKPGRYVLKNRMSNNDLVNMLRSGNQEAVQLTFNNVNTLEQFSERIAEQLEFSNDSLMQLLEDEEFIKKYGFNQYTIPAMFIPNTYEVYWNTSPAAFLGRMYKEYNAFWTKKRLAKAKKIELNQTEVITLASIVNKEVRYDDEKRRVAGLYMNRIEQGIRLQADPTLIFAMNDFTIRRVLNKHKQLDSPYNTYKYYGLPPGPICIPDIASIDAVLNFEKHKYIYMCAKPDFSGYHNFAKTLKEHNKNAEAYRRELNKRRIYN
jgi:UPF0755 protein